VEFGRRIKRLWKRGKFENIEALDVLLDDVDMKNPDAEHNGLAYWEELVTHVVGKPSKMPDDGCWPEQRWLPNFEAVMDWLEHLANAKTMDAGSADGKTPRLPQQERTFREEFLAARTYQQSNWKELKLSSNRWDGFADWLGRKGVRKEWLPSANDEQWKRITAMDAETLASEAKTYRRGKYR